MEVKYLRNLALDIFRTLNQMNPEYEFFYKMVNLTRRLLDSQSKVDQNGTNKYGRKNRRSLRLHILNSLPRIIPSTFLRFGKL